MVTEKVLERFRGAGHTPLYEQIAAGVRMEVLTGALPRGGRLPSIRVLARGLQVNPATVARAYRELASEGVVVVRRGQGRSCEE